MSSATFARLERAWNSGDGAAFAAEFTDDAHFVDVRGVHHHGRAAIARGHQAIFDTIYRGSTVTYAVETTHRLNQGCALAMVDAVLDVPAGPVAGRRRARLTATFVADEDRWAIAAFHNTLVQATS